MYDSTFKFQHYNKMLVGRYVVNHDDLLPSGMVLTLSVSVVVQLHFGLEAAFSAVKTLQSLDFFLPLLNSHLHNSAANVAECDKSTTTDAAVNTQNDSIGN